MKKGMSLSMKFLFAAFFVLNSSLFISCTDPNEDSLFVTPTTEEAKMSAIDILERDANEYSLWLQLLKHANYYNALKDGSAKATVFCPTNAAIEKFLKQQGVSTVAELDSSYAKQVVRVHIINKVTNLTDSLLIGYAKAGQSNVERGYTIPNVTLFGTNLSVRYGYIKTDVDDADRNDNLVYVEDSIYFNNQARLEKFTTITCSNAVLFSMGDVILPLTETIMDKLDADKDTYSIFAAAVRECGYDSIANKTSTTTYNLTGSVVTNHYYTCMAVPNSVYQAAGINDVAGLKNYLSSHASGADADLSNYIKYHFLPRSYTKDELFSYESDDPEAEGETLIFDTQFSGQAFIVNKSSGKDIINKGFSILRSNIQARNGYIHRVDNVMPVYHPSPVRIKWDFLNSADIISYVNRYGALKNLGDLFSTPINDNDYDVDLSSVNADKYTDSDGNIIPFGTISSFTYELAETKTASTAARRIGYHKEKIKGNGPQYGLYMNNNMVLNLGFGGWIQFKSPTIIAGKYKIVLHYLKTSSHNSYLSSGTLVRFDLDSDYTMSYLYKGLKKLKDEVTDKTLFNNYTFEGSGNHIFKITLMDPDAKNKSPHFVAIDYLEFVPVE